MKIAYAQLLLYWNSVCKFESSTRKTVRILPQTNWCLQIDRQTNRAPFLGHEQHLYKVSGSSVKWFFS